jgi:hypothetical protein
MVAMNVKITITRSDKREQPMTRKVERGWERQSGVESSATSLDDISPLKTTSGVAGPSPIQFYVFAPPRDARAALPRDLAA